MFIHRRNVDQYIHAKPRAAVPHSVSLRRAPQPTLSVDRPALLLSADGDRASRSTATTSRVSASSLRPSKASANYTNGSDSEEIEVEEVFDARLQHHRGAAHASDRTARDSLSYLVQPRVQRSLRSASRSREPALPYDNAQGFSAGLVEALERGSASRTDRTATITTAVSAEAAPVLTAGFGGLSPLSKVSPGESRLSEGFALRRGGVGSEGGDDHEAAWSENETDRTWDDGKRDRAASMHQADTRYSETLEVGEREHHRENDHGYRNVDNTSISGTDGSLSVARESAGKGRAATSTAPAKNTLPPAQLRSVSDLEKTLAAATKALTAAAAREAERRLALAEEEKTRVRLVTAPCVEVQHIHDAFLSTALTDKVLLFEAYLAGAQGVSSAMTRCEALLRRDAERSAREAETALQLQERTAQHKVALYRQHVTAEAARVAAEAKNEEERRAAEERLGEIAHRVAQVQEKLTAQEAALQAQQREQRSEELQWRQVTQASALELRALQRAHAQATERWMALQVSYAALRDSYEELHRRQSKSVRRRDVSFHDDGVDCFGIARGSSRILRKDVAPLAGRMRHPLGVREEGINGINNDPLDDVVEDEARGGSRVEAADLDDAGGVSEEPTALEALLARTTSDSGLLLLGSPLVPQAASAAPRTTQGCFSSPPGTPLLRCADENDAKATADACSEVVAGHSPDAQPAPLVVSLRDGGEDESVDRDVRRGSASTRHTSSMRPSRLNSVASTRRGSSPSQLRMPEVVATMNADAAATSGSSPLSHHRSNSSSSRGDVDVVKSPGRVETGGVEELRGAEWDESRLRATAALVVQRELSRLLRLTIPPQKDGTLAARRSGAPFVPSHHCSPSATLVSTPSILEASNLTSETAADAGGSDPESVPVPLLLPALQWMRVCETAHHSAQVCSRLDEKLQRLIDSFTQRLELLEEKDWNKTMARRFIAVEHAAALQRVTQQLRSILDGTTSGSGKHSTPARRP